MDSEDPGDAGFDPGKFLAEDLIIEWPVWRLIACEPQMATLEEINRSWNYDDILRGNAVLNLRIHLSKTKAG